MKKRILTFILMYIINILPINSQWKEISEGLEGGNITSIAKNSKNELFITTYGGGVFYSSDFGENWFERNNNLNRLITTKIFSNDDTLILHTSSNVISYSFDKGLNWKFISTNLDNVLKYSVYLNSKFYTITSNEFAVSYDTCKNWILKNPALTGNKVHRALFEKNEFILLTDFGLYSSSDYGDTWILKPFEYTIESVGFFEIIDNKYFFADYQYLYYSFNQGENWSKIEIGKYSLTNIQKVDSKYLISSYEGNFRLNEDLTSYEKENGIYYYQSVNSSIKVDSAYYFCTNRGIFKSTDNCKTWDPKNNGLSAININYVIYDNNYIYAISGNGLFKRDFTNRNWQKMDLDTLRGLSNIITIENRKFFPTLTGIVITDTLGNYIETKLFDGYYATRLVKKGKKLFVNTNNNKIYVTYDIGKTWKFSTTFLNNLQRISSLGIKNDDIYIKISDYNDASKYCYISKNDGEDWEKDTTLTKLYSYANYDANIFDNNFYASIDDEGFAVNISTDYGHTWQRKRVKKKNPLASPSWLAGTKNFIFAATDKGVFLSIDKGDNWLELNEGLSNLNTNVIKILGDDIYLGTTNGVYTAKLSDFGLSDIEEPKTENDNYLYSFPAYPVPSSNGYIRAMIYWDNKDNIDNVKITITNSIGEIIPTESRITLDKSGPNNGTLNWNCSGEPKGAYFIKIQHGDKSNTLKVIVE